MIHDLKEIKILRKKLGLTQIGLAKLSGVSQSLIAKIESNRIDPTFSHANKIFDALNDFNKKSELQAKDVMNGKIHSIEQGKSISEAIGLMKKFDISQMPVVKGNSILGLVSEGTLLQAVINGKKDSQVSEIMDDSPPVVSLNSSVNAVANLLKFFPLVIVSDKGKRVGVIAKSDILNKAY